MVRVGRRQDIRLWLPVLLGFSFAIGLAAPAHAVTYGIPDVVHPSVGAILLDFDGPGALQWCTGTLISPRVLLTAGHCTQGLDRYRVPVDVVRVSFALNFWSDPASWRTVDGWVTHPEFRWGPTSDPHDLGVIVLARPETSLVPASLAPMGYLDGLAARGQIRGAPFAVVGYGQNEHGVVTGYRQIARSIGLSLHSAWLYLSQNPHRDAGGTCEGDSGGPTFHSDGGSEVLVAVTSWGDAVCVATGINYRTDKPDARTFLATIASTYG